MTMTQPPSPSPRHIPPVPGPNRNPATVAAIAIIAIIVLLAAGAGAMAIYRSRQADTGYSGYGSGFGDGGSGDGLGGGALGGGGVSNGGDSGGTPNPPPSDLLTWLTNGGKARIFQIATDINRVHTGQDEYSSDSSLMPAACATLHTDVNSAAASAPIPVTGVQTWWSAALGQLGQGSAGCSEVRSVNDLPLMNSSLLQVQHGIDDLSAVISACANVTDMTDVWNNGT
ncbi:MAG TPA: hypothetical protein VK599_11430 [Streptosporangiaceae bacterium]|nr:hypothetical protein [Streptosporangiaceae bacterium]